MKRITWNEAKAVELRHKNRRRGVSFEECYEAIIEGKVLDIIANPSEKYSSQKLFILDIMGYPYSVPYIENDDEIFLKTVYPNRKFKKLLKGMKNE